MLRSRSLRGPGSSTTRVAPLGSRTSLSVYSSRFRLFCHTCGLCEATNRCETNKCESRSLVYPSVVCARWPLQQEHAGSAHCDAGLRELCTAPNTRADMQELFSHGLSVPHTCCASAPAGTAPATPCRCATGPPSRTPPAGCPWCARRGRAPWRTAPPPGTARVVRTGRAQGWGCCMRTRGMLGLGTGALAHRASARNCVRGRQQERPYVEPPITSASPAYTPSPPPP